MNRKGDVPRPIYEPQDTLKGTSRLRGASLLDFWKWAFSDLCDDDLKGIFAEWLVMKLLGLESVRRMSWSNSDIITPEGVRIEVKASSYWQSWKLLDEFGVLRNPPLYPISSKTRIAFAGLKARDAVMVTDSSASPQLKSDIYVFVFQHETDCEKWNALDLSQWEFYVLPAETLRELGWKSISLPMLRSKQNPLSAVEFIDAAKSLIRDVRNDIHKKEVPAHGDPA